MRSRERPRHRSLIATAAALVIAIGALAAFALAGGFDKTTTESVTGGGTKVVRVALVDATVGFAPGQVLHALQELRQLIDDRLREDLSGRYDRHSAQSVGTDKLTVTFTLRAATHADAIRSTGLAAGTLAELLTDNAAGVDLSRVALVVRAQ